VLQLVHIPSERDRLPTAIGRDREEPGHETSAETSTAAAAKSAVPAKQEYGEFLHTQSKRYYDFNEIRKEIEAET
jgi:dynamin 1-like protein